MLTQYKINSLIGVCVLALTASLCFSIRAQQPIPVLQSGHYSGALALRADGQLAVTGGYDGLLKWWDRKTGLLIRSVPAHSGSITTVAFNSNGSRLLSGGTEGVIKIWEPETGREVLSFRAYPMFVRYAAFSPDGQIIASCGGGLPGEAQPETALISLWDVRNGSALRKLRGHSASVSHFAFDSTNGVLVSASDDRTLKIWSILTGQLITTIQSAAKSRFVGISPDGKIVVAVTVNSDYEKPELGFYNVQSGQKIAVINDSESWGGTAITADRRYFIATSAERFKVWDLQSKKLVKVESSERDLHNLAVSRDGSVVAFGGRSSPSFWSDGGFSSKRETPSLSFTTGIAISADSKLVAWGSGNEIYVWSNLAAALLYVLKGHSDQINEVAFTPDGRYLASCSQNQVKLWSTENGALVADFATPKAQGVAEYDWNGSQSVSFSPDGRFLATGEHRVIDQGGQTLEFLGLRIWDVNTRRLIRYFKLPDLPAADIVEDRDPKDTPPYWIRSIVFSPDGKTIASDNGSNRIVLLDVQTGRFRSLTGHQREINSVAFSPDGKLLVSAGFDQTVKVWNVSQRRAVRTMTQHQNRVTNAKFSPNGKVIISGSLDRTVRIWDAASGSNIAVLENHEEPVTSIGVTKDGTLFSTGLDGRVNLWSLNDNRLLGTVVADTDNSWVCFSPDGFYSGVDAEKYLAWRVGGQIFPANTYKPQFFRPEALLARLKGLPLPSPIIVQSTTPQTSEKDPTIRSKTSGSIRIQYPNGQSRSVELYKRSYALLIGNSVYDYSEAWNDLPGVQLDMREVKKALENQGFKVVSFNDRGEPLFGQFALNVNRETFRRQVELFIQNYGQDEENRLLIYYAGHGYTALLSDTRKMGYLVMRDAPRMPRAEEALRRHLTSQELSLFYPASINMDEIEVMAKNITARHALFVFDSCFAGTVLFRDTDVKIPSYISAEVAEPVRQFLTAGNELQKVPDDSIFRRVFVRGIEGAADTADGEHPRDGYILATELYAYVKREVVKYSENKQTPVFGKILKPELARGDFVFVYQNPVPDR